MTNWDDYRLILALARAGTLRATACMMGITHTTVSRRLEVLQAARGALFEKTAGGYAPTELGRAMIDVAQDMERLSFRGARHQRGFEDELAGEIRLSLPEAVAQYLLLDDLLEFTERYPAINLTIETGYAFADLDRSEADIVVRGSDSPSDHLVGRRLFPTCVTYYADRDYLARTPADELRWIAPAASSPWPEWLETSPYPNAPIALVIDDITARHLALVKGLGLGRGACFMADPEPGLVRLSDAEPIAQQDLWVLTHPDLRETPRVRVLQEFLIAALMKKKDAVLGLQG